MTAGVLLHARARGLSTAGTALLVLAVVGAWAGRPLSSATVGIPAVVVQSLTCVAAVALIGAGLTGADPDLEASAPRARPGLRLVHLTVALAAVAGTLVLGQLALGTATDGPGATLRNVVGLGGLLALTATAVGTRLAWTTPVVWVLVLSVLGPRENGWRLVASMPLLPVDAAVAALTAAVLVVVGAAAYSTRGAR